MAIGPRLDLRQSQSLVMTPQLSQAIRLLALSNLEIETFIAEEVERNPLLELAVGEPGEAAGDAAEPVADAAAAGDMADPPPDIDAPDEIFQDGPGDAPGGTAGPEAASGGEAPDLDAVAAGGGSLCDHLLAQAGACLSGIDLIVAREIVWQIDEAGYLEATTAEIAHRLGLPLPRVERVLGIVQGFDPTGVGARGLAECLMLQAREADRYDPCMATLIDNLDLLARGALPQLRRLCRVDEEDFTDMVRELRGYDPKPGLRYGGDPAPPVVPDVFVARTRQGWAVELNGATLPRLLIDRRYQAEVAGPDRAGRSWLTECLASANWLAKALDQRAQTIVKVTRELVRRQEAFFVGGVQHLRPMTLRDVAEAIGMHESTVSRVTSNKYLSCERGLFELKYFFTSGTPAASADGEAASAEAVKNRIARLIAAEPPDATLSDDALVQLLNAEGFGLARRTVAKYREAIGLGSSVQRRRRKALAR